MEEQGEGCKMMERRGGMFDRPVNGATRARVKKSELMKWLMDPDRDKAQSLQIQWLRLMEVCKKDERSG